MATGLRKTGDFCWINMLTPQPAQAREFFSRLLGWTYAEIPGMGHKALVGGREIAGLFDLDGPNAAPGTLPHIGVLLKVDSADATCEKVTSLGGQARPAFDIEDQGRIAACSDPNGAGFVVWEPNEFLGTDADSSLHGAPSWFETMTTDVDRATKFYSGLFGWTPEVMVTPGFEYTTFKRGTEHVAGMMQITPRMGDLHPHWRTYFTVRDADLTAREAVELGATISMTMKEAPGVGRFCGITSPQGVPFCVIQFEV
jgi:predicted enzyme related to lactoylglutathione lyase